MAPGGISTGLWPVCKAAGWRRLCRCAPVLGAAIGAALAQQNTPGRATITEARALRHEQLRGVVSGRVFSNVNRNDARPALKVWFDVVARQRGYILDSTVDIVDSAAEIRKRLQSQSVEMVTMGVVEYLELESSNLIVPVLTDARTPQGGALYSYVLLVKPSAGVTSIASLRGKTLMVSARGSGETGMAWLEVLLSKEKLGRAASFFASVTAAAKAQACILPVFFGTVDACVVDEVNLNLSKEMNPQLGQLSVLARSRPMIESVIGVPAEPHPYQKELIDGMLSLHEDPRGRQLLMVFKTERLVRLQPGDLDSARELWRDYYRLPGSAPNRPAGSGLATTVDSHQADRGKEGH
jgi:ABC-type phosphate/phosphonate transport system substrate-binding protein